MVGSCFPFPQCGVREPLDEDVAEVDGGNDARGVLRGISDDVFVHGNGAAAAVEEMLDYVEAIIDQVEVLVHVAVEEVNRDTLDTEKGHSQLYVSLLVGILTVSISTRLFLVPRDCFLRRTGAECCRCEGCDRHRVQ
jgi:hypothetical protein